MKEALTIEAVEQRWNNTVAKWNKDIIGHREALGVTGEQSVVKLEEAEDALRKAWNKSHAGFKLVGFKVEVKETATLYPVGAWLMFTPDNGEESSLELSTRFGGVFDELVDWINNTVGVDKGIQLELKLPMFHEV